MSLFSAVPPQPAPAQVEMEGMKAELSRLKNLERLRRKHGQQITDEQVAELLAEEADMEKRRAAAKIDEEKIRQDEVRLDEEYRKLACKLIQNGDMIVSVGGKRVKTITPDLITVCPECGKPLGELSAAVYNFAKVWHWCAPSARTDTFMIYSARSPLTEQGIAAHLQNSCPNCRKGIRGVIQMVVV